MSLERLSKLISIGFGMALIACLITLTLDEYYGAQAEQVTDRRHQTITGVARMATLNRELTQLARLYVSTGDELFLTEYNQKWQKDRTFREAAEDFRAIGLTDEETRLLANVEEMDLKQTAMERQAMEESWHRGGVTLLSGTTYINSEWNFASALNQLTLSITQRFNTDFEAARNKAALASHFNVLMQLITLGAGIWAFLVLLRRQLMIPLLHLSERMRRLRAGEAFGDSPQHQGLAEVVTLAEAFDAYVEINEELHQQHWVKGHLGELVQALQSCASREAFAVTVQQKLGEWLGCNTVLLFDAEPFVTRTGQVHYSLPLQQQGQQLASLELDFAHRPGPAQLQLLDSLPNRLGTLLSLLEQRLHNQQLLQQAHLQADKLREAHEQQQAIVTSAPYGIAVVQNGLIAQANSRLDELLGYAQGEQLQRSPLTWLDQVICGQSLTTLETEVREALDSGKIYQQRLQLRRKDSRCFWASVSARAIASANQSPRSIWIIEDISAQQAAADEMQQARQLAEDSARIKAEFLANMSHEIRTPMNAIIGMTHLTLKTELNERQRDYLSKVQSSSRHLLGVIDDILDFSKIEAGKLQLETRDFNLVQLLDEVLDQVRERIAEKGLDLHLEVSADVPLCLCGDPLRLRQILLNYLSNAVKFTERGQIRVAVNLRQGGVDDALLHFSVSDSGIGLSSEQLKHMFQSFQQADASTTRRFGGTGLGLAIAKQLSGLMGGQVGVQSVSGEGSDFWFEVRLQLARSDVIEGLTTGVHLSDWRVAEGTRILLVEDNELNQQVAAELLQAVGCSVDIAADGRQALNRLSEERYDLVFMDMQIPVFDGLAVTRLLRRLPGLSALPVVAMTANASRRDHQACLAAGMNDFVSKPFEPQTLYTIMQRWLAENPDHLKPVVMPQSVVNGADFDLKLDGLDMVAGLRRVRGRHSLYTDLLHHYLAHHSPLLQQLSTALAADELVQAELLAHSCKGASATIGADAIAQAAHVLEQALREKRPKDELQISLMALSAPLESLLEQLLEKLPGKVVPAPVVVESVELQRICRDLDAKLGDFDAQAVHCFSSHAGLLHSAFANRFLPLESAVKRFDFERARVFLREALQAVQATQRIQT